MQLWLYRNTGDNMPIKKPMDERERILNLVQEDQQESASFAPVAKKGSSKFLKVLLTVAVIILIVFLILFGVSKYNKKNIFNFAGKSSATWQSVFLSNGQVYFGKVTKENSKEVVLKDIYYLQVNNQIQPTQENAPSQPELSLVKLGNELHGPTDEMRINRFHVLFIEDLKADSRVVAAIAEYATTKK